MRAAAPKLRVLAAACGLLMLASCADPLLGPTTRRQGRQCMELVVPEQREACLRDTSGARPAQVPRELERPRPAPGPGPAVRNDEAAARAASRTPSAASAASAP